MTVNWDERFIRSLLWDTESAQAALLVTETRLTEAPSAEQNIRFRYTAIEIYRAGRERRRAWSQWARIYMEMVVEIKWWRRQSGWGEYKRLKSQVRSSRWVKKWWSGAGGWEDGWPEMRDRQKFKQTQREGPIKRDEYQAKSRVTVSTSTTCG